jgi:hypothetical protein
MSTVFHNPIDEEGIHELRQELEQTLDSVSELEERLRGVDFKQELYLQEECSREMDRLAHARMDIDPDDQKKNWVIAGQYQGVRSLMLREKYLNDQLSAQLSAQADLQSRILEAEARLHDQPPGE